MRRTVFYSWIVFLLFQGVLGGKVPTVYDVLRLVYQVCSIDELDREQSLGCVSDHMGKEVVSAVEFCMVDAAQAVNGSLSINEFCDQMTHVPEWVAKHPSPPRQLTRIMGLAALGRMACVLGEVQRPLPMWQAAFAKCFPDFRSSERLAKDSTKNRSANSLTFTDD